MFEVMFMQTRSHIGVKSDQEIRIELIDCI